MRQLDSYIGTTRIIGLFPEGAGRLMDCVLTTDVVSFKRGFAYFAIRKKIPVLPVCIVPDSEYTTGYPLPRSIRKIFFRSRDFARVERRIVYREVTVHILPKQAPPESDSAHDAVGAFSMDIQKQIQETITRNAR